MVDDRKVGDSRKQGTAQLRMKRFIYLVATTTGQMGRPIPDAVLKITDDMPSGRDPRAWSESIFKNTTGGCPDSMDRRKAAQWAAFFVYSIDQPYIVI